MVGVCAVMVVWHGGRVCSDGGMAWCAVMVVWHGGRVCSDGGMAWWACVQ